MFHDLYETKVVNDIHNVSTMQTDVIIINVYKCIMFFFPPNFFSSQRYRHLPQLAFALERVAIMICYDEDFIPGHSLFFSTVVSYA